MCLGFTPNVSRAPPNTWLVPLTHHPGVGSLGFWHKSWPRWASTLFPILPIPGKNLDAKLIVSKRECYTYVIRGSYQQSAEVIFLFSYYRKEQTYENSETSCPVLGPSAQRLAGRCQGRAGRDLLSPRACGGRGARRGASRRQWGALWERADRAGLVVVVETAGPGAHGRLAAGQDFSFHRWAAPCARMPTERMTR